MRMESLALEFYTDKTRKKYSINPLDQDIRDEINLELVNITIGSNGVASDGNPQVADIELPRMNYFRHRQTNRGDYFLSGDSGNWTLVSASEYESILAEDFSDALRQKLEKSFILLTENNLETYIDKIKIKYGFLTEGPTLHIIVVTSKCNLTCVYCQASSPTSIQRNMEITTAMKTVDKIFESPSDSYIIEFQGGEPLMNYETVKSIINYAESKAEKEHKRVEFSLITNFTRTATKEKLKFLIEHNVSVCFSLDGPRELHESNRGAGYQNAFDVLLRTLESYKTIWKSLKEEPPELAALVTTTSQSLPKHKEIIDTYLDLGLNKISIRPLSPLGIASENTDEIGYTSEEFMVYWKKSIEYILKLRSQGIEIVDFYLELLLTKIFGNESGFMDLRSPCGASYGQITYNYDGTVASCDEGRMIDSDLFKIGEVSQHPLDKILSSEKTQKIFEASIIEQYYCDYCAFKPYCGVCPVLHQEQSGSMNMNVLESDHCKIFYDMYTYITELYMYDPKMREILDDILLEINWQKI